VTGQLIEFHRTGKLRILAVTSPGRLVAAPDLPTAVETLPGMVSQQLIGLFAPAETPRAIIDQIAEANHAALAEPAYQHMLVETGFEPDIDSSPKKFRRLIEDEIAKWTPIVNAIGIRID
jgi:tripartite-type tricarboxylate transporter receptor subunit TctC